jgi:Na+/H+ antiporter NhaD/arsenite permease-like protein
MSEFLNPPVVIFVLTYLAVAVGDIPGLALDRTGMALLGAIAMVACGVLTTDQAVLAIDFPTLLLLFGLMVVSTQFRLGGFYTQVALQLTRWMDRPRAFLLAVMLASAVLSALLANDIVCLAFAPVLAVALLKRGLNPLPFLLGLALSSNIGSAATIMGNPQNMLIGQLGRLHFGSFLLWCTVPSVLSLLAAYGLLSWMFRRRWMGGTPQAEVIATWPAYDSHQSRKAWLVTAALVALFFTSIPRELTAMVAAGLLLCSRRMSTRSMLGLVDWHLITLFCGLFVVIRGLETTGLPERMVDWLASHGVALTNVYTLAGVSVLLSNLVSNVPATMLLAKFVDPAQPTAWYVLAVSSTFAGNLFTIGSIANLIVIEQSRLYGIRIRFWDHVRVGLPVTLISLVILVVWMMLTG